ncbi:hypothetical protein DUNSADRAFT_9511 [Dunaliella salina]|uniref:GIY-YIG homing endonuclease n=1 Tax=Dunaliella salina TaxID=3046 RepID=A0ABQ7GHA9_DUNSA|nr:hypothetical protein DUNSADRAFT_9511 [Dunaliella salina]|eukprot:KAF5833985.1 hypothetical protein DUNSADRAFT_9511 [Dunaliella salina]
MKSASAQDASTASALHICVEPQNPEILQNLEASGPGVYKVFDESGKLQYVGVSKQMALSLAGHAQALGPQLVHHARCLPVPSGRKADLQQAWKAAIVANGAIPPGNAKGETAWTQKPAPAAPPTPSVGMPQPSPHPQAPVPGTWRFSAAAAAAADAAAAAAKGSQPARPSLEQLRATTAACSHPAASAAVTQSRVHQLCTQGFFVVDGVADPSLVASAHRGAESLRSVGLMIPVSQQRDMGRLDEILVFNEQQGSRLVVRGPKSVEPAVQEALTTPESASLAALAALLKGIPQSIMQHAPPASEESGASSEQGKQQRQQQQQQQQQEESGLQQSLESHPMGEGQLQNNWSRSSSSGAAWQPPEMAVPQSLMLAVYPAGGVSEGRTPYARRAPHHVHGGPHIMCRGPHTMSMVCPTLCARAPTL